VSDGHQPAGGSSLGTEALEAERVIAIGADLAAMPEPRGTNVAFAADATPPSFTSHINEWR
jgi:hypothetical protein